MHRPMMSSLAILVAILGVVAGAVADEHVVAQNDRQFLVNDAKAATITIKVGDTISFRNEDRIAHNVFSRTPGMAFNLGIMRPGASGKHTFAQAGAGEIECALHPQMKFKVEVAP
jgi:plastocyanin